MVADALTRSTPREASTAALSVFARREPVAGFDDGLVVEV
jgi:hypothetical protein